MIRAGQSTTLANISPLAILDPYIRLAPWELLEHCKQAASLSGFFSDYPTDAKLETLGLAGVFNVVLTAQSPEVGASKPDLRGLLLVTAHYRGPMYQSGKFWLGGH